MMDTTWDEAARRISERIGFQLASAELDGERTVVVRHGGVIERLDRVVSGGAHEPDTVRSVSDLLGNWDGWTGAIAGGLDGAPRERLDPAAIRLGVPLRPAKMICIGSNYREHVDEMHRDEQVVNRYPYSFLVPASTGLSATGASVKLPSGPRKFDWEGEIGVVIGRATHGLSAERALEAVAGYVVVNDLCVRDYAGPNASAMGVDWVMSKAYDGFKPIGPYVTPSRFVADPQDLPVRTWVNGGLKQDGNSRDMIFTIAEVIAHLSTIMTLEPGDVIATGTPDGVGHGRRPPEYLTPGDHVVVEVGGLDTVETHLT